MKHAILRPGDQTRDPSFASHRRARASDNENARYDGLTHPLPNRSVAAPQRERLPVVISLGSPRLAIGNYALADTRLP